MQKIIINIVFIFLLIAINAYAENKTILMKKFNKALENKENNITKVDKSINNITIFLPKNLKEPFNTYIENSYTKLKQKVLSTIQEDCKKTGWGYIGYNVNYSNKELISIKKMEGYSACYGKEIIIPEYINLFLYNQKLYQVKLSNHAKMKMKKVSWKDEDCRVEVKNKTMFKELKIKKGKPYIHIYLEMDKVCGQDILLDLDEKNFEFLLLNSDDYKKYRDKSIKLNSIVKYINKKFDFNNINDKKLFNTNQKQWLKSAQTDCSLIYKDIGSHSTFLIHYNQCLKDMENKRFSFLRDNYVCKYSLMSGEECEVSAGMISKTIFNSNLKKKGK